MVQDQRRTKKELIEELERLRRRTAELEESRAPSARAHEALQESQKRYQALVELAPDIIYCLDPEGNILHISRAVEALGYRVDELLGTPFEDIVHPDDRGTERNTFIERRTVARGARDFEVRLLTKNHGRRDHWLRDVAVTIGARGLWTVPDHQIKQPDKRFLGSLGMARDVTERKRAQKQVQTSLQEKEILLREIHHRVKNNLQFVSSLLSLQFETGKDKRGLDVLHESQDRIDSMALVHEQLCESEGLAGINMGEYIRNLVAHLSDSYGTPAISHKVDAEPVPLDLDAAVPCGLILNELWSNAVKHAFPDGRSGVISVGFRPAGQDNVELAVRDNGVGLPEGIDLQNTDSLGLRLVGLLVGQLKAAVELDRTGGTAVKITFPRKKEGRRDRVEPEDPGR